MAARQAYNPGELAAAFARSHEGTRLGVCAKSFYYKDLAQAALGSLVLIIEVLRQMNKART